MGLIYRARRVGRDGREFDLFKIRTLRENKGINTFAHQEEYTWYGKFLRRFHLDEVPQIINILKGQMGFFGWRPEEPRSIKLLPLDVRNKLFSTKPGLIDLASIQFYDEGRALENSFDAHKTYWKEIRPAKYTLQCFYIDNKNWLLNLSLLWMLLKRTISELGKRGL